LRVFKRSFFRVRSTEHYLLKLRVAIAEFEHECWIATVAAQGGPQENSFARVAKLRRKIKQLDLILSELLRRN